MSSLLECQYFLPDPSGLRMVGARQGQYFILLRFYALIWDPKQLRKLPGWSEIRRFLPAR
jgi:hypothetical protein